MLNVGDLSTKDAEAKDGDWESWDTWQNPILKKQIVEYHVYGI